MRSMRSGVKRMNNPNKPLLKSGGFLFPQIFHPGSGGILIGKEFGGKGFANQISDLVICPLTSFRCQSNYFLMVRVRGVQKNVDNYVDN